MVIVCHFPQRCASGASHSPKHANGQFFHSLSACCCFSLYVAWLFNDELQRSPASCPYVRLELEELRLVLPEGQRRIQRQTHPLPIQLFRNGTDAPVPPGTQEHPLQICIPGRAFIRECDGMNEVVFLAICCQTDACDGSVFPVPHRLEKMQILHCNRAAHTPPCRSLLLRDPAANKRNLCSSSDNISRTLHCQPVLPCYRRILGKICKQE